jgi:hypothetical protein
MLFFKEVEFFFWKRWKNGKMEEWMEEWNDAIMVGGYIVGLFYCSIVKMLDCWTDLWL